MTETSHAAKAAAPDHPTCHGCRHVMEWGIVIYGQHREALHGQCMRYDRPWPDGCRHYAERAK